MSQAALASVISGSALTPADLRKLEQSGVDRDVAEQALLRRVDSLTGAEMVGQKNRRADYAGILIPNIWPGQARPREYRLRRDKPEVEETGNGRYKERNKYISPPGRGNMLYLVPGTALEWLSDRTMPIVFTEGEKKALSLWSVGWHGLGEAAERPRWLSIALSGVWNWRGTVGKAEGPKGDRRDVKGPIPDLNRIVCSGRDVIIIFDSNVQSNDSVLAAQDCFSRELRKRGARVKFVALPQDAGVNGIDDLVGLWGKERVLDLIQRSAYDPQRKTQQGAGVNIDQIPNVFSFDSKGIQFVVEGLIARGSVTMLAGESGHGKSTLTAAIADSVTKGRDFCGRKCAQLPVLILDRENGIDAVQERFVRLGICKENCKMTVWGGWCESEPPDPSAVVVLAWVKKTDPKPLVIIDSVAAFMEGDENNASDVRKFMDKLRELAHLGAAVIALHNSGKAETSLEYRGSSDFKGSIDVGISVRNFGEGELGKIRLKAFKTRFTINREVILNYSGGRFISDDRPHSVLRTVTEQLTALLRKNPGVKTAEFEKLAVDLQLGRDRARQFLDTGIQAGEVRVNTGVKGAKFHFLVEPREDGE